MSNSLSDSKTFRTCNVVDDYNLEVLVIEVDLNYSVKTHYQGIGKDHCLTVIAN